MTQKLKDNIVVGPDAESQLIEKPSGQREIRCRSHDSYALVIRTRQQALDLIQALAKFATELE